MKVPLTLLGTDSFTTCISCGQSLHYCSRLRGAEAAVPWSVQDFRGACTIAALSLALLPVLLQHSGGSFFQGSNLSDCCLADQFWTAEVKCEHLGAAVIFPTRTWGAAAFSHTSPQPHCPQGWAPRASLLVPCKLFTTRLPCSRGHQASQSIQPDSCIFLVSNGECSCDCLFALDCLGLGWFLISLPW